MDSSFKSVVAFYKPIAKLTEKQDIQRLYRGCLRTVMSWAESREVFNDECEKIRIRFDAGMKQAPHSSALSIRLIREAKEQLAAQTHPDPYIKPYMPGGSMFMRNPPFPIEAMYPPGMIPKEFSKRRINIDYSNIPDDQEYADKAFVDSANKLYWIDR
eukprot:CAMPEP_0119033754 /NCGR_PEP_ID=MMETSP1177-20130426/823_1 /TAXON_ID=2985 /ORGANISM="Ochromonas sp, Strain CCMP1899" /LENGTH=157 /DNA_ID=CAMNT_0006990745 /DNA_START=94 /DNA_END=567 /DNA_ORIENTATION=+